MFNNLVNYHDLTAPVSLWRRGRRVFFGASSRIFLGAEGRVKAAWRETEGPPANWWDVPAVQRRWNRLISGDPGVDYQEYVARTYLAAARGLGALALACGTGAREVRWAGLASFSRIEGYDLSPSRIERATRNARERGLEDILLYRVGDVRAIDMGDRRFDVVFGEQALHHLSRLDELMRRIERSLKPGGYFIVNDFVGPSRFQWTARQIEVVNALLAIFPDAYKTPWKGGPAKRKIFAPSRVRMILRDPSEAIESSRIVPLLREIFDVVEIKGYGGTVLHLLLAGIAHHFIDGDEESRRLLEVCFDVEDAFLARGELESDFVVAVCRKRLR